MKRRCPLPARCQHSHEGGLPARRATTCHPHDQSIARLPRSVAGFVGSCVCFTPVGLDAARMRVIDSERETWNGGRAESVTVCTLAESKWRVICFYGLRTQVCGSVILRFCYLRVWRFHPQKSFSQIKITKLYDSIQSESTRSGAVVLQTRTSCAPTFPGGPQPTGEARGARTTLGARNRLSRASPSALADLQAAAATAVRLRVLRWSLGEVRGRLVRRRAALSFSWDPPRESVAQSLRETLTAARDCYRYLTPP